MCFEKSEPADKPCEPCWPTCQGWTFDWIGLVHPCGSCRRLTSDAEAATAFRAFMQRFPVPARAEHQCSPTCRGWDLCDRDGSALPGYDIEACDDCGLFANDDALEAAVTWMLERLSEVDGAGEAVTGGGPC
jgi:hypothetical protein